jgi:hypothetical protein
MLFVPSWLRGSVEIGNEMTEATIAAPVIQNLKFQISV